TLTLPLKAGTGGTVTYMNTGLAASTTYAYRVYAYNAAGVSATNGPISVTTQDPPAAPSGIAAAIYSATKIKVTFTDNAANEQGFKLERSTDGGVTWTVIYTLPLKAGTGLLATYYDTAVTAGNTYTYQVRAYNDTYFSGYDGPVSV